MCSRGWSRRGRRRTSRRSPPRAACSPWRSSSRHRSGDSRPAERVGVVLRTRQRCRVERGIEARELREAPVAPLLVGDDQLLHGNRVAGVVARQDHGSEALEPAPVVDVVQHRVDAPSAGVVDDAESAVGRHLWQKCWSTGSTAARYPTRLLPSGAAATTMALPTQPASASAPRVTQVLTALAPDRCRLTFRSPPRAQEWISGRNVPFTPRCSERRPAELSADWWPWPNATTLHPRPRRFPGEQRHEQRPWDAGACSMLFRGRRARHSTWASVAVSHDRGPRDYCYREHFLRDGRPRSAAPEAPAHPVLAPQSGSYVFTTDLRRHAA